MATPPPRDASSVRNRLLADHQRIASLVQDLVLALEARDETRAQGLFDDVERQITAHMDVEDRLVIPALARLHPREARTLAADHEHIRRRLVEMKKDQENLESVRSFLTELRAHTSHEDRILYQWAEDHLPDALKTSLLVALATP